MPRREGEARVRKLPSEADRAELLRAMSEVTRHRPTLLGVDPVIFARSPVHPHGAVLFLDWLISRAGQQVIANEGRTPVRTDVRLKSEALKRPFRLKLFVRTANDSGADQNTLIAQFNQLFGLSTGK